MFSRGYTIVELALVLVIAGVITYFVSLTLGLAMEAKLQKELFIIKKIANSILVYEARGNDLTDEKDMRMALIKTGLLEKDNFNSYLYKDELFYSPVNCPSPISDQSNSAKCIKGLLFNSISSIGYYPKMIVCEYEKKLDDQNIYAGYGFTGIINSTYKPDDKCVYFPASYEANFAIKEYLIQVR